MSEIIKKLRRLGITATITATAVIVGCSDDSGLERRYPVSGTVTYKGSPVAKGTIAFQPSTGAGYVASGYIENGSYTLTTSGSSPGDGALPGDYKVSISSSNLDVSTLAKKTGGLLHQGDEEHQKAAKAATSPIPTKYAQAQTSGLTAKVEARSNKIDFPLSD
jgi:hypothetical protein